MKASLTLPPSQALIEAALTGLVAVNEVLIQAGVVPPSPLQAGVRYQRERSGLEDWNSALEVIKQKWGDCEDLNAWECARLRVDGDDDAHCIIIRTGPRCYHCVAVTGDGQVVDVCPALGMRKAGTQAGVSGLAWLEAPRWNEQIGAGAATFAARAPTWKAPKKSFRTAVRTVSQRAMTSSRPAATAQASQSFATPTTLPPGTMPTSQSQPTPTMTNPEPMQTEEDGDVEEEMEDPTEQASQDEAEEGEE